MTTVAICIPAYRPNVDYLCQLLESVEVQSLPADQIVVHFDGEPPDAATLHRLRGAAPHVKIVHSGARLGMAANWNAAVRASSCGLVMVPGQDDVLHDQAIRLHKNALAQSTSHISCSNRQYIDGGGKLIGSAQRSVRADQLFDRPGLYWIPAQTIVDLSLAYGNVGGEPCGTMFRRSAFDEVGGYDDNLRHAADLDLTLRLALSGGSALYHTRKLSYCRLHSANLTKFNIRESIAGDERHVMFSRYRSTTSNGDAVELGRARLLTHDLYDVFRSRRLRSLRSSIWRSGRPSVRGLYREMRELAGAEPTGREWVRKCQLTR